VADNGVGKRKGAGGADEVPKYRGKGVPLPLMPAPSRTFLERAQLAGRPEAHLEQLRQLAVTLQKVSKGVTLRFKVDPWTRLLRQYEYPAGPRNDVLQAIVSGGITLDPAPDQPLPEEPVWLNNHPSWYLAGEYALKDVRSGLDKGQYKVWPKGAPVRPWIIMPQGMVLYFNSVEGEREYDEQCEKFRDQARAAARADRKAAERKHPLGWDPLVKDLVFKDVKKGRILHDARFWNDRGKAFGFQMSILHDFVDQLRPGDYMFQRDLKGAYRQLLVRLEEWLYLAIVVQGRILYSPNVPFGVNGAPYQFTAFLGRPVLWCALKRAEGVLGRAHKFLMSYIDDYLGSARRKGHCQAMERAFDSVCDELNVEVAPDKSVHASQRLLGLGMIVDTSGENVTIECPTLKLEKIRVLARRALSEGGLTVKRIRRLVGKIQSVAVAIRGARRFSADLFVWLREVNRNGDLPETLVVVPSWVRHDLTFFADWVDRWNGKAVLPARLEARDAHPQCFSSDAAGADGELAICWFGAVVYFSLADIGAENGDIAWREFVAQCVLRACMAAFLATLPDKMRRAQAAIDNTNAQVWFEKERTPRTRENAVARRLGGFEITCGCTIDPVRLPSKQNALSDCGTRQELRGEPYRVAHTTYINSLPSERPKWWPYQDARYPPLPYCRRAARGGAIEAAGRSLCQGHNAESPDLLEQVDSLCERLRDELRSLHG
jgi:hypothetical protein